MVKLAQLTKLETRIMSRIVPLFLAFATLSAIAPGLVSADTLTITISNIRVSEGRLMVQVGNSGQGVEFAEDSAAAPVDEVLFFRQSMNTPAYSSQPDCSC